MTHIPDDVNQCGLHRRTPFAITGVSRTQLSIARFSGMIKFNGDLFIYFPDTDELVRDDVLAWSKNQNAPKQKPNRVQEDLF